MTTFTVIDDTELAKLRADLADAKFLAEAHGAQLAEWTRTAKAAQFELNKARREREEWRLKAESLQAQVDALTGPPTLPFVPFTPKHAATCKDLECDRSCRKWQPTPHAGSPVGYDANGSESP